MQGYCKNRSGIIDIGTVPAGVLCIVAVFLLCSSLFALHL